MDKIIVPFRNIRGLGNILIPKSLSDYTEGGGSHITSSTAVINNINSNILILNYSFTPIIVITSPGFIPFKNGQNFSVPIQVVDTNNNPVHDVTVGWEVDGDFTGTLTTDSNGRATFTYAMSTSNNQNKYNYAVEFEIAASDNHPSATNSITVKTGCSLSLARTGYVEE